MSTYELLNKTIEAVDTALLQSDQLESETIQEALDYDEATFMLQVCDAIEERGYLC